MVNLDKVKNFAKSNIDKLERPNYNFRSRYHHTLRILMWVERVQPLLGGDITVLQIAALLHDIGWDGKRNHAEVSYDLSKKFVDKLDITDIQKDKILEGILYHNARKKEGLGLETYILQDADLLDEVGASSIVLDILGEAQNEEYSYYSAYSRMIKYNSNLDQELTRLHFDETKKMFKELYAKRQQFITSLEYELGIEK